MNWKRERNNLSMNLCALELSCNWHTKNWFVDSMRMPFLNWTAPIECLRIQIAYSKVRCWQPNDRFYCWLNVTTTRQSNIKMWTLFVWRTLIGILSMPGHLLLYTQWSKSHFYVYVLRVWSCMFSKIEWLRLNCEWQVHFDALK